MNIAKNLFTVIQIFKLLYVLILWVMSQRNISTVCQLTGSEAHVCPGMCIHTEFVIVLS